jgi:hypothetical protein
MRIHSVRFKLYIAALFAAAFVWWNSGCAKIAPPQPPEIRIPKPAADLAARQVANAIVLTVSKPTQNTNGSPANTLQKVDVLRLAEDAKTGGDDPLSREEFLKRAIHIQSIPSSSFADILRDNNFIIQDALPFSPAAIDAQVFRYAVLFVNNKNQAAGLSNQIRIRPITIPPPPEGLFAEVTEHSIKLKWKAPLQNADGSKPARIAGYALYRSEDPATLSSSPIKANPLQPPEYEDPGFEFDKTYYYAVRTIGSFKDPPAESLLSKALSVNPRDVFPPAPPKDFRGLLENSAILLLWAPSSSADVAGYRIYRQEKDAAAKQLLQKDLITLWSFRDNQATPGKSYEYSIKAVDSNGNESEEVRTAVETR